MNKLKVWVSTLLLLTIPLTLTACNITNTSSVATVNGVKISALEFKYFVEVMKQQVAGSSGGQAPDLSSPYQDTTLGQYITDESLKQVINLQVQLEQAKTESVEFGGDEDQKSFDDFKSGYIEEQGGRAKYDEWLKKTGLNEETLNAIGKKIIVANKIVKKYQDAGQFTVTDEEIKSTYDTEYLKAKHILVIFPEATPAPEEAAAADGATATAEAQATQGAPSASAEEATKVKADSVYARVTTGKENFDKVMNEVTDDKQGLEGNPNGYTFTKGDMVPEFYEAAMALKVGEISQPVRTSYGYHIIKKEDHINDTEGFNSMKETISGKLQEKKYNDLIESWKANFEIKVDQGQVDKFAAK